MRIISLTILCATVFVSCDYFKKGSGELPVARVNESYLYEEDLKGLVFEGTSKEDSILIIENFVTRWATQQLLIDQAEINLSQEELDTFEQLVEEYKKDLYIEAYKNTIVSKQLDSTISMYEFVSYYETNKENFRLNVELYKIRYIHMDVKYSNVIQIKEKFSRFNTQDKLDLTEQSIQFKSNNFNDSIWVEKGASLEHYQSYSKIVSKC